MTYPPRLLSDDERIILDLRPHWISLFPAVAWLAAIIAVVVLSMVFGAAFLAPFYIPIIIAIIAAFIITGIPFLRWSTTQFLLTNERLITREGILAKKSREIPLNRINDITFTQSLMERLVSSGNLSIESAGEQGMNRFVFIKRPEHVQNEIYKAMEASEKSLKSGMSTVQDIPEQIDKLAALRDRGIVTPEEFERKKKELLDRM
jgi:uncharacterized membrane protein YdbT with pleckstrin-like domain